MNKRDYLYYLLVALVCVVNVNTPLNAAQNPRAYLYSVRNISDASYYIGWPTVAAKENGELVIVYSGGRQGHIGPYGRLECMHSSDNGQTWSTPQVLIDSILDDRDAGVCQTQKGSLLVTWFTSTTWLKRVFEVQGRTDNWSEEKVQAWKDMKQPIKAGQYRYPVIKEEMTERPGETIQWMIRSEDDGKTWSDPYTIPLMSPHGPIAAVEGRLLMAGKAGSTIGLCQSTDDGKTWSILSKIKPMSGHNGADYHELHVVEAADGTLIGQTRNHNDTFHYETLQTESTDGGESWTPVHSIAVWGYPSHLLRLDNDQLVMTYSHRGKARKPVQSSRVEARISADNGKTWSEPMILSDHLSSSDFGYPSSVELANGKILTVWYEVQSDSPNAVLRQAVWEIR